MKHLLGRQFAGSERPVRVKKRPPKTVADAVYDQLTEDYPKDALKWVHSIKWEGPKNIPIKKIDFSEKDTWRASHEPEKIRHWKARIRSAERRGEHVKPGILIERPARRYEGTPYMIPDGHHRALAYEELGKPDFAFIGKPRRSAGPWDILHDQQYKDDTGPARGGDPGAYHYGRK